MPQNPNEFKHLSLPFKLKGRARLYGHSNTSNQTDLNKQNKEQHSGGLGGRARNLSDQWKNKYQTRIQNNLPEIPPGIPFVLEIDPESDNLEFLLTTFNLEVVSEQEDGFVIVASEDFDLTTFFEKLEKFAQGQHGGGNVAKVYSIHDDETSRLQRILSEELYQKWPQITDNQEYIVEVGVECLGTNKLTDPPEQNDDETEVHYTQRLTNWRERANRVYQAWDDLKIQRETAIQTFVDGYGGQILNTIDGATTTSSELPDSFTTRISISGGGLRDLAFNFPYVFEIVEPDDVKHQFIYGNLPDSEQLPVNILPPDPSAPKVCVIDSGIQEGHRYLAPAIDSESSYCYLPNQNTDVADHVDSGGHGTRVAGAILYPREIPRDGIHQLSCWIQNARVLDSDNKLPEQLFPPTLLRKVIDRYHDVFGTKLFNHSIAGILPCRRKHMSAWASEIDKISFEKDILLIQAAGNIYTDSTNPFRMGVKQHLASGRNYPDYLLEDSCRVPNPAQSLNALTVGAITETGIRNHIFESLGESNWPSAITSTGPGIWDIVKPDVVEYGGTYAKDTGNPPNIVPIKELCPELIRANTGPAFARDTVGTSFAAPKVSHIASVIQSILPDQPALLYRALIAQSARWPSWTEQTPDKQQVLRYIGYGLPDLERSITNNEYRVTLITNGLQEISAREAHVFEVNIPDSLRDIGEDHDIRIEITLSYAAIPRRTRRNRRGYLSTWLDWHTSHLGEPSEDFANRIINDGRRTQDNFDDRFPWLIGNRANWGAVRDLSRSAGTLQKDWAIIKSRQLSSGFCIGVVGHPGWDKDPDTKAKYTLAISFESVNRDIEIYSPIQIANEIEIEQEQEVEIEI